MAAFALNHPAAINKTVAIMLPNLRLLYSKRAARLTSHCTTQNTMHTPEHDLYYWGSHETKAKLILRHTYDSHIA